MSNAYKCDRCGELYEESTRYAEIPDDIVFTEPEINDFHLCDDCQEEFKNFMDGVGLSRETDCRTEQTAKYLSPPEGYPQHPPKHPIDNRCSMWVDGEKFPIKDFNIRIKKPENRTVLKEQVDMGAKNY